MIALAFDVSVQAKRKKSSLTHAATRYTLQRFKLKKSFEQVRSSKIEIATKPSIQKNFGEKKMVESVLNIAEKLGKLLIKEAEFLHKVKKEVESLSKELKALGSDLKKADVMTNREDESDEWVSELRDLAFKAEDVIEVFVNNATPYDGCNVFQLGMGCICQIITLHKLNNEIDDINIKLKNLPKKSLPFTIQSVENGGETSSIHHDQEEDLLVSSRANEDDNIVGFQEEANKFASSLTKEEPQGQLFVVSIWGQAGAGKTALARNIYKRSDVNNQFDCVAWVSVSPDYHVENIWQAILKQVENLTEEEKEKLQGKKSFELLHMVFNCLKEKNYLIVLDDLWKQTDWMMISMAFPKSQEKKCRVLITTRIEEVARAANPSTNPEILRVLNDDESLELFLKKVYGCSSDRIPVSSLSKEMKDVARKMLSRCEGLPIAIVLLGGILSAKRKDIFEWMDMLKKIGSDLAELTDLRKVFSLSYNELPYASKPCFLCFGLFPEDSVIECDKLIRLWVAEGFMEQREDKIMEDMARDCLKGLIQRSMVQIVECKSDGDPQTCRTHDLVRSLAIQEAKKAKFSSICKKKQLEVSVEGSCRRIALHPQDFEFHIGTSSAPLQPSRMRIRPSVVEANDLVGIKEEVDRLLMLLTEEPLGQLTAVSIVGMGGIGKTRIARHVYNKIEVKSYFTCRAWVNVSQQYAVRNILKIILQQVTTLTDAESKLENEDVLQRMLHNHFKEQQSYLVVLDNIWRREDWDVIRKIFPEPLNSQSCRILLTSRSADLVYYVSPSRAPFQLRLLNDDECLELLLQTIFMCSLDEIPEEAGLSEIMMDMAREFVMLCRGIPLAIVLLGGLLSVKREEVSVWVNVLQSLKRIDSHFILLDLFSIAYEYLPYYLKPCFLSLKVFPEDTEIACDKLIRLWDEEGYLKRRDNNTMEEVARDYLEELIQRKLIEVAKRKSNGTPEICQIHDLLRDFVSSEPRNAEFPQDIELVHESSTSIAPHFQAPKTFSLMDDILSFLDPFKFPNHIHSLLCLSKNPQFFLEQFQLLRVLDLEGAENFMEVPKEIRNLTLLRYLSLRGTRVKQIPSWIANLRNLQTLDAPGSKIPIDALKLNQLRHLFAHSFYLSASAAASSSSSSASLCIDVLEQLQTLELADISDWEISGLHKLTYLRVLRLRRGGDDTVLKAVYYLWRRLKFLSLTQAKASSSPLRLPSLLRHNQLYDMVVEGTATEAIDFPPLLTYLWLDSSIEHGVDPFFPALQNLGLLKKLCLRLSKGKADVPITFSAGGFQRLEFLYIKVDFELENWTVEEGALPSLSVLHIEGGNRLGKLPDGLSYVKTLKELIITRGYDVVQSLTHRGKEWEKVKDLNPLTKYLDESSMNP